MREKWTGAVQANNKTNKQTNSKRFFRKRKTLLSPLLAQIVSNFSSGLSNLKGVQFEWLLLLKIGKSRVEWVWLWLHNLQWPVSKLSANLLAQKMLKGGLKRRRKRERGGGGRRRIEGPVPKDGLKFSWRQSNRVMSIKLDLRNLSEF